MTRTWTEKSKLSGDCYSVKENIKFKNPTLRSNLCDCSDAYIVVKWEVTVEGTNNVKKRNKNLIFKNNPPFGPCIFKIKYLLIDNTQGLDILMPMYNLLEYN